MTVADRLWTGLNMTVLGMGLVFLLLALLWGILTLMLRLDSQPPSDDTDGSADSDRPRSGRRVTVAPEVLAAITVAVSTHRAVLRKRAAPSMRSHWPGSILFASRWVGAGRHQQTQNWHPRRR